MENYILTLKNDKNQLQLEHAESFQSAWSQFDPEATGKMDATCIKELIRILPPPLGLDPAVYHNGHIGDADVARYAFQMHLRT